MDGNFEEDDTAAVCTRWGMKKREGKRTCYVDQPSRTTCISYSCFPTAPRLPMHPLPYFHAVLMQDKSGCLRIIHGPQHAHLWQPPALEHLHSRQAARNHDMSHDMSPARVAGW